MSAERIYRLLLRAYPFDFRAEYGREMLRLFRDQCREGDVRSLGFWIAVISDVARSAPALWAEAWRARWTENTRTVEATMKLAAMLTVLLAVLVLLGAGGEWAVGSQQAISGAYVLAVALGVLASVLLLVAGVAILSGTPRARQTARVALVASLASIVAARVLHPWMSIFTQLVGIGLPVALLIALYWPRRPSSVGVP